MLGHWETDGSSSLTHEGTIVKRNVGRKISTADQVCNAIWIDRATGITTGRHYWQFHFIELIGSVFVGLTDRKKFRKGQSCQGLLYGNNQSFSSRNLVGMFGPMIQPGDIAGILVVFESGKFKIYFDVNGIPSGLIFDLDNSVLDGAFPMVQFSGTGKAAILKSDDVPAKHIQPTPPYEEIVGSWKCKELNSECPLMEVTIDISKKGDDPETYTGILRAVNKKSFSTIRNDTGSWQVSGQILSTRTWSHTPGAMELEGMVTNLLSSPTSISVEKGTLLISNSEETTSKWERILSSNQLSTQISFNQAKLGRYPKKYLVTEKACTIV